jgi:hypothetical protein
MVQALHSEEAHSVVYRRMTLRDLVLVPSRVLRWFLYNNRFDRNDYI